MALLMAAPSVEPAYSERGQERARWGRREERNVVLRLAEDKEAHGWRNTDNHGAQRQRPWWLHALCACAGADERGRNEEGEASEESASGAARRPLWKGRDTRQGDGALLSWMVATRPCMRHFVEHVTSDGAVGVGHVFGLVLGRFSEWAKNKVCSTPNGLQI
jgi:hypothetical protein